MKWLKWLIVMCSVAETLQTETLTTQGTLRGEAHEGYISYQGIPYASVNDTARFKGAGLAPRWSGIRESQQTRCSVSSRVEDCLQLDVHVPTADPPWPVLVWVKGSGGQYNPGRLVREGIVVVVVSHRFGPLGFLCLEDEKIPGNAGVKDVLLALRWVRDNISAFKGNPHKVVVGGQGFAAAIVEVLLLSPNAQDLLHGAIMQSGSSLSPWAFNFDARERALLLAQSLGNSEDEILTLVKASIDVLSAKSHVINVPYIPFGICIEKSFKNEERVLPEPPYRLLSNKFSRKVPLIIGYNSDEAYIFLSLLRQKKLRQSIRNDLTILIPEELKFLNRAELRSVVEKIQDLYFKNFSLAALLAYHRDAYFVNHILRSTHFHAASHQPVYMYRFSYAGQPGVYSDHQVKKSGAAHSDELAYLFPENYQDMEGDEGLVQQNLIRLWTNFVKYLVPTPTTESLRWESVEKSFSRLLDISTTLAMQDVPRTAGGVWDDIYNQFYYERNALQ